MRELVRSFEQRCAPPEAAADDRRKRAYVALSLVLLIPVVLAFGISDLLLENRTEGVLVLGLAVFMIAALIALPKVQEVTPLSRLGIVATLSMLLYGLRIGGGAGLAFFWFYLIPILLMTLFGRREGSVWALGALASAALAFVIPHGYRYEPESLWRFLATYVIVFMFSYGLETARNRFFRQLLAEKAALEEALAQVKTLRGLLPICTHCKKVRDDRGYWQEIEQFIDRHSEVELSHGMCPKCAVRLYPDLVDAEARG